jgi:hypothetical protein
MTPSLHLDRQHLAPGPKLLESYGTVPSRTLLFGSAPFTSHPLQPALVLVRRDEPGSVLIRDRCCRTCRDVFEDN